MRYGIHRNATKSSRMPSITLPAKTRGTSDLGIQDILFSFSSLRKRSFGIHSTTIVVWNEVINRRNW